MVAMPFEQQTALPRGACGIEPGQRLALGAEHAMLCIHPETAFAVHEDRAHRTQGNNKRPFSAEELSARGLRKA